ncbi:glutathione S-transferase family protein [Algicella marina]|uniref:Glutathione S-transferase n=1 Tax=Algicella marina TaxID=2683284 RepID=A0A6P1SWK8_9RHOB|nr:glutathione S-transferase family protein [Algicella marina]QHQ33723.1 glutathione S-transferase [Algicella marina]
MITLWGRSDSSNVQAVRWCLEELSLDHDRKDAGHRFGVVDTPAYRALNPNGTVPTLQDGDGSPIWESGAILRYLANRYAKAPFWPEDPLARAQVDKWAEWAKVNIATRFTAPVFWRVIRTPPSRQEPAAIAEAMRLLIRYMEIAEDRLATRPFLATPEFTLADIVFGHVLYRYFTIPVDRPHLPHVSAYYQRLTEREAYARSVMVSYEALRETD